MQALRDAIAAHPIGKYVTVEDVRVLDCAFVYVCGTLMDVFAYKNGEWSVSDGGKKHIITPDMATAQLIRRLTAAYHVLGDADLHALLSKFIWCPFVVVELAAFQRNIYLYCHLEDHVVVWSDDHVDMIAVVSVNIMNIRCYIGVGKDKTLRLSLKILTVMQLWETLWPRNAIRDMLPGPIAEEIAWFSRVDLFFI